MKINVFFIIASILFLTSCSAKVTLNMQKTYPPLDYTEEVRVFQPDEKVPSNAEKLGIIKSGDSGFSIKCSYTDVLDKAKTESRKVGGNALKITKHKLPDLWSSCHRITVDVLKIDNLENYIAIVQAAGGDSALIDADYAIINVYCSSGQGVLVNYDLYLGNSVICRVKNNFCESIKIYKDSYNSLWAKTESKTEIPINIEFGQTYYIRCGTKMEAFVGRHPSIEIVNDIVGETEMNIVRQKKNTKKK